MSFEVFQAERNLDAFLISQPTKKRIGPGTYNIEKIPFKSKQIYGNAPFSSMIERFT